MRYLIQGQLSIQQHLRSALHPCLLILLPPLPFVTCCQLRVRPTRRGCARFSAASAPLQATEHRPRVPAARQRKKDTQNHMLDAQNRTER
eukprot:398254-Rhodomonas_salina.4